LAAAVRIKFYSLLRRRLGRESVDIAAPGDGIAVGRLLRLAEQEAGQSFLDELLQPREGLRAGAIVLVNGENVRLKDGLETPVHNGDIIDLFTPAGGG
jgi:molybdopterin synthase sulfur carrier subunit